MQSLSIPTDFFTEIEQTISKIYMEQRLKAIVILRKEQAGDNTSASFQTISQKLQSHKQYGINYKSRRHRLME